MTPEQAIARRSEPWPWIIVALHASMIAIALGFFAVAVTHPDVEVASDTRSLPSAVEVAGGGGAPR